jgi:hypothetical protein
LAAVVAAAVAVVVVAASVASLPFSPSLTQVSFFDVDSPVDPAHPDNGCEYSQRQIIVD